MWHNPAMETDFLPSQVEEGLWVGRAPRSAEDFAVLGGLGIQDVLTLQTEEEARDGGLLPVVARRVAATHGMGLHRVPITDLSLSALRSRVSEAVAVLSSLRRNGRRVYVHCAAGLNRSPTVVAGWLALSRGIDAGAACGAVHRVHPCLPDEESVRSVVRSQGRPGT
jgi:hypothetical protein